MPTIPNQFMLLPVICTAKRWERAAIVYAYVGEGRPFTAQEFADIGIVNLSSPGFVQKYRDKWAEAVAAGLASPVSIGDTYALPRCEFGKTGNAHMRGCTCGCGV